MDGCAVDTVWTWNAIGKRAGAWSLNPHAPEAERGFLLNHVIGELLPEAQGYSQANADPNTHGSVITDTTGQVVEEGETLVVRPRGASRFTVVGRVLAREWRSGVSDG